MDNLMNQVLNNLPEILKRADEPSTTIADKDYSFEKWQPLMATMKPFLNEEVTRLGISTEGKSEMDLVKEVFTTQEKLSM
ncbi:hypothetical protein OO007_19245 [Cocleimonas sp. KMM 6892]|jgi:hypothetical protein|uniref:hypothetical protein n=1 Tax=unclassified Cocleimonas TaxID=2639732 RepID=UPI002DBEAC87|nr:MULTISPECIES: hypothetical protein [unclassified Cocleimonas]MEB8434383.1 hypothetical protein [Cocleimonas sp. KMM 6892]MEC4717214.1 hypothetical protein [Cocleimonas sp. KMM 6895]MEC4746593.1 hypothetical protein [Cocleimonas sp. KMM 6896]